MSIQTALQALSVQRDNLYKHQQLYSEHSFVVRERLINNCEFFLQRSNVAGMSSHVQHELAGRDGDTVCDFLDSWWSSMGVVGTLVDRGITQRCWEDFERDLQAV